MQRMLKVAKRGIGGVGNVITTITTAAVDMVNRQTSYRNIVEIVLYSSNCLSYHLHCILMKDLSSFFYLGVHTRGRNRQKTL